MTRNAALLLFSIALILLPAGAGCARKNLLVEREDMTKPVRLVLCNVAEFPDETAETFRGRFPTLHADFVIFAGRLYPDLPQRPGWTWAECRKPALTHPRPSLPWPRGVDVHEYGPLHVVTLEATEPVEYHSDLYDWLVKDLSGTKRPWRIVVMAHSIFLPEFRPEHYTLAETFERCGVSIVVARGAPSYMRSYPIGAFPQTSVRYIVLPDAPAHQHTSKPVPPWVSWSTAEPAFCVLEATDEELRWRAYNRDGRLIDTCNFGTRLGTARRTRTFTIHEIRSAVRETREQQRLHGSAGR